MRKRLACRLRKLKSKLEPSHRFWLWEITSVWIATPIIFVGSIVYVQQSLIKNTDDFLGLGLSVIGLTIALAALSSRIASITEKQDESYTTFTYATERFAHSSLLLVQALITVFLKDAVASFDLIAISKTLKFIINGLFGVIITYVSSYGLWSWFWGFRALNWALWVRSRL